MKVNDHSTYAYHQLALGACTVHLPSVRMYAMSFYKTTSWYGLKNEKPVNRDAYYGSRHKGLNSTVRVNGRLDRFTIVTIHQKGNITVNVYILPVSTCKRSEHSMTTEMYLPKSGQKVKNTVLFPKARSNNPLSYGQ